MRAQRHLFFRSAVTRPTGRARQQSHWQRTGHGPVAEAGIFATKTTKTLAIAAPSTHLSHP